VIDTRKSIALSILHDELNIVPTAISRFTTGYCHSVYHVKTKTDEYVLRITSEDNKGFYYGSIKWLSELLHLGLPVPKILNHGQYNDVYFVFMTYIPGKDLGEVYHMLNDSQKHGIAKSLSEIQKKVSTLPSIASMAMTIIHLTHGLVTSKVILSCHAKELREIKFSIPMFAIRFSVQ